MGRTIRILLVEDCDDDGVLLMAELRGAGFDPDYQRVETAEQMAAALEDGPWDLIISDYTLPRFNAPAALALVNQKEIDVPFFVVSGAVGEETAVAMMRAGAHDYFLKNKLTRLSAAVERELREAEVRRQRQQVQDALDESKAELFAAGQIQRAFLPQSPPTLPGFDIAGALYPSEFAAGDYFDYLPMVDGSLGVVIGDAAGHRFGSALLMTSTRAYLRSLVRMHTSVVEILEFANAILLEEIHSDHFVTLFLGRVNPRTGHFLYASAGHETGYLIGSAGQIKARLESTGLPLGVNADAQFLPGGHFEMQRGDIVFLLTDGVRDARSPSQESFGIARALQVVAENREKPASQIIESLSAAITEFVGEEQLFDDVAMMVIKATRGNGKRKGAE